MIRAFLLLGLIILSTNNLASQTLSPFYNVYSQQENVYRFGLGYDVHENLVAISTVKRYGDYFYHGAIELFEYDPNTSEIVRFHQLVHQTDTTRNRSFGTSVVLKDHFLATSLVGDYVQIYTKDENGVYIPHQKLYAQNDSNYVNFGQQIVADDSTIVVSDPNSTYKGKNSGSIEIFTLNNATGQWEFANLLIPDELRTDDTFGEEMELEGNTLVVGSDNDDREGENSGVVYIFERHLGGENNWGLQKTLTMPEGRDRARFGHTFSLHDGTLVVGAPRSNKLFLDAGTAYIFERNNGGNDNWGLKHEILPPEPEQHLHFGRQVYLSDNALIIKSDSPNKIYQYNFNNDTNGWEFINSIPVPRTHFSCLSDEIQSLLEEIVFVSCDDEPSIQILRKLDIAFESNLDFGTLDQYSLTHKLFTITNKTNSNIDIELVRIPKYIRVLNNSSFSLGSEATALLTIEFTPNKNGRYSGELLLKDQFDRHYVVKIRAEVQNSEFLFDNLYADTFNSDGIRFLFKLSNLKPFGGLEIESTTLKENDYYKANNEINAHLSNLSGISGQMRTTLLIDSKVETEHELSELKKALNHVIQTKAIGHELKIITINKPSSILQDFTASKNDLHSAIESLEINNSDADLYYSLIDVLENEKVTIFEDSVLQQNAVLFSTSHYTLSDNELSSLNNDTSVGELYIVEYRDEESSDNSTLRLIRNTNHTFVSLPQSITKEIVNIFGAIKNELSSYYGYSYFSNLDGQFPPRLKLYINGSTDKAIEGDFSALSYVESAEQIIINRSFRKPMGSSSFTITESERLLLIAETNVDNSLSDFKWAVADSTIAKIIPNPFINNAVYIQRIGQIGQSTDIKVTDHITGLTKTISINFDELATSNDPGLVSKILDDFSLHQNYPNPFNPSTNIRFYLPQSTDVKVSVYDVTGRLVATLEDGLRNAGAHQITFDASALSSGIYFYRLEAGEFVETRKMILIK